jgi:hypothetical protein
MLSDNSYLLFHVVSQLKAPPSSCELVRTPKSEVLWVEFLLLHNFHGELTHRVLQIYKSTSLALNCGVEKKWSVFLGGLVPTVHTQVVSSKHSKHCALAVLEPILIRCNGGV